MFPQLEATLPNILNNYIIQVKVQHKLNLVEAELNNN